MKNLLHISKSLSFALEDFVTSTQAILAKKRVGKSYTAQVQAEELLAAKQQVVVLDPTDAWWGLRSSADGKDGGYPITIFGGRHGDWPLDPSTGAQLASAIITEKFSAVISLKMFGSKREMCRFAADFLETLHRENREAMHLFIDEADIFVPQTPRSKEQARCMEAADEIVRRGGIDGIGITLISQRAAVINKDVLSQIDRLIALRIIAKPDIDQITSWMTVHGTAAQNKELVTSLPSLEKGEAWIWTPEERQFQRVRIREKKTFDSGRTPKAGERRIEPKHLAKVDLERLGAKMAAAVERQQANDPAALRAKVIELERKLAQKQPAPAPLPSRDLVQTKVKSPKIVEKPVITDATVKRIEKAVETVKAALAKSDAVIDKANEVLFDATTVLRQTKQALDRTPPAPSKYTVTAPTARPAASTPVRAPRASSASGDTKIAGGERKILTVLAQHPGRRAKRQVAVLTGYAHTGGAFNNYLGALRTKGYIEGSADLTITPAGMEALGAFEPLPTGRALFEHWMSDLGKAEREILRVLWEAFPYAKSKEAVAAAAGYEVKGGGFNNALGKLRTLELIHGSSELACSEMLHEVS